MFWCVVPLFIVAVVVCYRRWPRVTRWSLVVADLVVVVLVVHALVTAGATA